MGGLNAAPQPGNREGEEEQRNHPFGVVHLEQSSGFGADEGGELALRGNIGSGGYEVEPQKLEKDPDSDEGEVWIKDQGEENPDEEGPVQKTDVDGVAEERKQAKKKPARVKTRSVPANSGIASSRWLDAFRASFRRFGNRLVSCHVSSVVKEDCKNNG
jgi:hypothetical protein